MTFLAVLFITLTLLVAPLSWGQVVHIPGTRIITDHLDVLRLSTYGGNRIAYANLGLIHYLAQVYQSDPTLKVRAVRFYQEVHDLEDNYRYSKWTMHVPEMNFFSVAGPSGQEVMKAGWVWDLAMKHADNDPQTAFRLIALCGHDNLFQKPDFVLGNISNYFYCPSSLYFLPRSLNAEADISNALKEKILKTKMKSNYSLDAEYFDAKNLSPKYYHVYAGAFVACEMISRGHSPESEIIAAKELARGYRLATLPTNTRTLSLQQLREWSVDFEWTEAQHVAGAKFAAKVCKSK